VRFIAHKGLIAGAKAQAATAIDLLLYEPLIGPQDNPPIEWNREKMVRFRPAMRQFYYDPARYVTYLDQLGVQYPKQ
jgi:aminobenzoyl-glutamate utilization protein B